MLRNTNTTIVNAIPTPITSITTNVSTITTNTTTTTTTIIIIIIIIIIISGTNKKVVKTEPQSQFNINLSSFTNPNLQAQL